MNCFQCEFGRIQKQNRIPKEICGICSFFYYTKKIIEFWEKEVLVHSMQTSNIHCILDTGFKNRQKFYYYEFNINLFISLFIQPNARNITKTRMYIHTYPKSTLTSQFHQQTKTNIINKSFFSLISRMTLIQIKKALFQRHP